MGNPKLELEIELALCWAYQRELLHHDGLFGLALPKIAAPGWVKMIDTGVMVDESHEPRFPVGAGTPHPDALLLEYAVRSLPDVRVDWRAERRHLMGDLADWLSDDDLIVSAMATGPVVDVRLATGRHSALRARAQVRPTTAVPMETTIRHTVALHARLGNRPVWDIGAVRMRRKGGLIGRQLSGKHCYTFGSHHDLRLDPPAHEIASARFGYTAWHRALVTLASVALKSIKLLPPKAPAQPWIDGEPEPAWSRIWPSGAPRSQSRIPLTPVRERALPPIESRIEIESRRQRRKKRLTTPKDVA